MTVAAQLQLGSVPVPSSKDSKTNEVNPAKQNFAALLNTMQRDETKNAGEVNPLTEQKVNKIRDQINKILVALEEKLETDEMFLQENTEILEQLTQLFNQLNELQESFTNADIKTLTNDQMLTVLQGIMNSLEEAINDGMIDDSILSQLSEFMASQTNSHHNDMLQATVFPIEGINQSKFVDMDALIKQVDQLLNKISSNSLTHGDYKQLLRLLEQWTQVNGISSSVNSQLLNDLQPGKNAQIWQNLLSNYLNKESMQQKYSYANKVTIKDLESWLMKATESYEGIAKTDTSQMKNEMMSQLGQPVQSKVQQYVIHLNQANSDQSQVQKQLLDQFQQIMSNSKFMKLANGTNQLTIKLHPEHLGDINVKLTQVNGEMIVKMIVQSQGAKELLEGNLTQLRHLFTPQQVTIEKLDSIQSSNQENVEEDAQANEDEQSQQSHHQQDDDEQANDEKINFHEMLMDAKV